jgi:TonB-dependent SusC/RagA subfamily outer membrane receptor
MRKVASNACLAVLPNADNHIAGELPERLFFYIYRMNKRFVITILVLLAYISGHSQGLLPWVETQKSILYEKVYLHVDREFYAPGEKIWFKTYLVNGLTHQLLPGYKNIFVQLVSEEGKVFSDRIILSIKGTAQGDFLIGDSIPDGQYFIRAYTKYLENFGEESYFHKKIVISKAFNSPGIQKTPDAKKIIDVSFWPESGNLVLNAMNYIAFKAVDETGKNMEISGKVTDENDSVISAFRTDFQGMGKIVMMPLEEKSYSVRIDQYPGFIYRFRDFQQDGFALHCKEDGKNQLFTISRNFKRVEKSRVYLVASHKGIVLFYREMEISSLNTALKIGKNVFPPGISKITLLDPQFNELAERLIFINDNISSFKMEINGTEFKTREKVDVLLDFGPEDQDTIQSTLSVAVVNKDYLNAGGSIQTMKSYLLLDSELKGAIENPSSFFSDEKSVSSAEKLDLLLMVQGWRSYYWNELNTYPFEKLKGWNDAGLTVSGYVRALLKNRPVIGGEVVLGPFSGNMLFEQTRTDTLGRFRFDRLYLMDSALIILNAKNERERVNTEIIPEKVFPFQPTVPVLPLQKMYPWQSVPMLFSRDDYYRQLKMEEFIPEKGSVLLGEVEVVGLRKEKEDGHFRLYGEPDNSLKIKEEDYTYQNILDYLQGKVAGVIISGDQISIRGGGTPLFLLDGIEVDDVMFNALVIHIPMNDIDKIEVLKGGANLALFGSKGANGVIAVYTKKGDVNVEMNRYIKGRITQRVRGFKKPSQFYSPRYTPENIRNPKPDYRPTLYWEPALQMGGNHAAFTFFTSDELSDYSVIVEGISKNGKICSARSDFSVKAKYNP